MNPQTTAAEIFDLYAEAYQEKFMDLSLYHHSLNLFCSLIEKPDATILDLACGPGNISKYLLGERPDFKVLCTDLAPNMLALAKANNPTADFQLLDCRALSSLEKSYDAIICGFGLPYLSKEEALQLIADASECLLSGGLLYLSTMEDDYDKSGLKSSSDGKFSTFLYYHQADYLIQALELNGFTIMDLSRISYSDAKGEAVNDLVLIARK